MKKQIFVGIVVLTVVMLLSVNYADAQWRNETHDMYNAPTGLDVTIDGILDEWAGVMDAVTGTDGTPFCGVAFEANSGAVTVFEEYDGGTWSGAADQEVCFMITWDANAIYLAISVTDDEFEHGGADPWGGDSAQISFVPSGIRENSSPHFLYNGALDSSATNVITRNLNETTHGNPGLTAGVDVAITRDDGTKKTYYEFKVTTENLGIDGSFSVGDEVGLGICVNDGDTAAGQGGQKGWGGWYPHAVVYGKNSEKTGLVVLSDTNVTPVQPAGKAATTWGNLKSIK